MAHERPIELFLTLGEANVLLRAVETAVWEMENDPYFPRSSNDKQERIHLDDLQRYLKEALVDEGG